MSSKALYIIIAVLILLGVGFYIYNNNQAQAPAVSNSLSPASPLVTQEPGNNSPAATATPATNPATSDTSHFSNESDLTGQATVHQVIYDGKSFSPASLSVKVGDIVVFKNDSSSAFWPASAPHPTHTDYPEFDSKASVAAGSSFQFKFTKVGSWGYHNHLKSAQFGKIIVTQ